MDNKQIPNKLFFKIGEVCEITDTQPYVLRYWESEFPALAPAKNSSGQRIYRRKDIETVLRIKQLLYEEGFTIAGAKKRLEAELGGRGPTPSAMASLPDTVVTTVEAAPAPADPSSDAARAVLLEAELGGRGPTPSAMASLPDTVVTTVEAPAPADPSSDAARAVLLEVRDHLRGILTLLDKGDRKSS